MIIIIFSSYLSLYLIYPRCAPPSENGYLQTLQASVPRIKEGEGRSFEMQAVYQLIGLIVTLSVALISGAITGDYKD